MSLPKVTILYSNGNLLQAVSAIDGICGIVGTGVTVGLLGVPNSINNLKDAETLGYTLQAEPAMYRHLKEFYGELGGNQQLWIMIVPDTMTMAQMLDDTNASGAKKLTTAAGGTIRLLGVYRKPVAGYSPGANFLDADVSAAVTASKTFGDARLAQLTPLRMLIEGRVAVESSNTIYAPNTASNGYTGVVLGGTLNDLSASVGLALARAAKYPAHIKVGKVANGPLSISTAFIGTKAIKDVSNLTALHDAGFISFMQYPQKAGFYFGIDHMASADDYRLLVYGRIVDKAAVIAAAVYTEQLEGEVDVDGDGKITETDCKHLEGKIDQQVKVLMADQISSFQTLVDPNQNIINTNKLTVKIRVQPKGYTSFIDVDLGISATGI